jgi:hypothetical protein
LADTNSLTVFRDSDIAKGSFRFDSDVDSFENSVDYEYGPEPITNRVAGSSENITSDESVTNWGEKREAADRVIITTRIEKVAEDIAQRQLLDTADIRYSGEFKTDLRGTELVSGQLIKVNSEFGMGPQGWMNRILMVTNTYLDPNDSEDSQDAMLVTVEWEDVDEYFNLISLSPAANSFFVSQGVTQPGPYSWAPIGSTSSMTAQPLGSTADGTARRLS